MKKGGDNVVDGVFLVKNETLLELNKAYWFGSGWEPPFEDFCKLDGTGCPIPEQDLVPIIVPSVIGALVLVIVVSILGYFVWKKMKRANEEREMMASMVLINFRSVDFSKGDHRDFERRFGPTLGQKQNETISDTTTSINQAIKRRSDADQITPRKRTDTDQMSNASMPLQLAYKGSFHGEFVLAKRTKVQTVVRNRHLVRDLLDLRDLRHQHVNPFIGVTVEPNRVFTLQQYCSKKCLRTVLRHSHQKIDRMFKMAFAMDIANGMNYLHDSRIKSHGQLTADNVYVDARWVSRIGSPPVVELEITAKNKTKSEDGRYTNLSNEGSDSSKATEETHVEEGKGQGNVFTEEENPIWMAPELVRIPSRKRPVRGTQLGDIYSYGIILYEIITKERPYETENRSLACKSFNSLILAFNVVVAIRYFG